MTHSELRSAHVLPRMIVFVAIIAAHVLAILAVNSQSSAFSRRPQVATILAAWLLPPEPLAEASAPPPLPSAALASIAPVQIVAPDIALPISMEAPPPPPPIEITTQTPPPVDMPDTIAEQEIESPPDTGPVRKPRILSGPHGPERYPWESLRANEAGRPHMKICISAAGAVESVELTRSSGFPRLDSAAVDIAREYRFKPAMRQGKPVPVCLAYGVDFRMN
jgi:protein TonB